jgi:hypothetical protein
MMSKRKNRELREREAQYQLERSPYYVAGARASGIPDDINPALQPSKSRPAA